MTKVLFTPNLEKARHDEWISSLSEKDREMVKAKVGGSVQWFKEDLVNLESDLDKSPMYSSLSQVLGAATPISAAVYQPLVPVLSALGSISVLDSKQQVELNSCGFSEMDTAVEDHQRLVYQRPISGPKSNLAPCVDFRKAPKELRRCAEVFLLIPNQQKALNGPNHQFILGVAGTGKTNVIKTKALQLLAKGEKIQVLTPPQFKDNYKALFADYDEILWEIRSSYAKYAGEQQRLRHELELLLQRIQKEQDAGNNDIIGITESFVDEVLKRRPLAEVIGPHPLRAFSWLNYGHLFVDDASDEYWNAGQVKPLAPSPYIYLLAMVAAERFFPDSTAWIALDPCSCLPKYPRHQYQLLVESLASKGENCRTFDVTILSQIMRCSASIFHAAYGPNLRLGSGIAPVLGHTIQGLKTDDIVIKCEKLEEAAAALCEAVKAEFMRLISARITGWKNIAIVMTNDELISPAIGLLLRKQHVELQQALDPVDPESCLAMWGRYGIPPNDQNWVTMVHYWDYVSSREWSIVINTVMVTDDRMTNDPEFLAYAKYRAATRATTKLINILVTYKETPTDAWTFEETMLLLDLYKPRYSLLYFLRDLTEAEQAFQALATEFNLLARRTGKPRTVWEIQKKIHELRGAVWDYVHSRDWWLNDEENDVSQLPPEVRKMFDIMFISDGFRLTPNW